MQCPPTTGARYRATKVGLRLIGVKDCEFEADTDKRSTFADEVRLVKAKRERSRVDLLSAQTGKARERPTNFEDKHEAFPRDSFQRSVPYQVIQVVKSNREREKEEERNFHAGVFFIFVAVERKLHRTDGTEGFQPLVRSALTAVLSVGKHGVCRRSRTLARNHPRSFPD